MENNINPLTLDNKSYIEFINEKLKSVMPEVHRQVKVYEEKINSGKLTTPPKNNPLFSE